MRIIKHLVEQITEELKDAEKYTECAIKYKAEYPELAATYIRLAEEELGHAHRLHDQVVHFIKEEKTEPPPVMHAIWDWEHGKMVKWEHEIKLLMDMYRQ